MNNKKNYFNGFSLLEVMIATTLISIVILSSFKLIYTNQYSNIINYKFHAINIADEILNRIRLNKNAGLLTNSFYVNSQWLTSFNVKNCYTNKCSYIELAKFDIHEISKITKKTLPNYAIQVKANSNFYKINVYWNVKTNLSKLQNCTLTTYCVEIIGF